MSPAAGRRPSAAATERRRRFLAIVRRVPRGRVVTYGQVAALAGLPRHAREVGRCLATLGAASAVPWQRVVNARGAVSPRGVWGDEGLQRRLLEGEGVVFGESGRMNLERYLWEPRSALRPPRGR